MGAEAENICKKMRRVMTIWALRRWAVIIAGEMRSVIMLLARGRRAVIIAGKYML